MTTNTEYPPPAPLPPAPRPPLRRSRSDKVLAGVAGGFAQWLGIDPVIVRVVLVVLAVFGGSGLILYAIGWLVIPVEGERDSEVARLMERGREPGSPVRVTLIVIAVIVGLILFANVVGYAFGGWGGGSVLLLIVIGALVLYLVNRQPTGTAMYAAPPPPQAMASPEAGPNADGAASALATTEVLPGTEPTAYAYGGSGQYPGYVAPVPAAMPPQPPRERSYLGLITLCVTVIVTGVLIALAATGLIDPAPVVIPAVALAILGAGILVGAWYGRARWLLWFAVPTLFVTVATSFIPANIGDGLRDGLQAGVGERVWAPTTVVDAQRPFELGIGSAELDLTDLVIPPGVSTIPVDADVQFGELIVTVPDDVRVILDASVDTGELQIEDTVINGGTSPSFVGELPGGPATGPVLDLTLHTNVGSLEVSRA